MAKADLAPPARNELQKGTIMTCISRNKNVVEISLRQIDYGKVFRILKLLETNEVSVFETEVDRYVFKGTIPIEELKNTVKDIESVIFDGEVEHCEFDKEFDVFANRKVFVDFNLGEKEVLIFINLDNTAITFEEIKKEVKKEKCLL